MSQPTVAVVIGTRPEAIKMAPVVLALRTSRLRPFVVATAQHRAMLDQTLAVFGLTPDADLNVMRPGQGLGELTARLVQQLEGVWNEAAPAMVLVQGDTTSSFAAALAAYYRRIPIGHIEAGLRTYDKYAPFPEEMNRRMIDAVADVHFAPTARAREALRREGIPEERIHVTGNTGIDALHLTLARIRGDGFVPAGLDPAVFASKKLILVTGHRRENFGERLRGICTALRAVSRLREDAAIVYAVHQNPQVQGPVTELLSGRKNVFLTPPLDYDTFVYAMSRSDLIVTDSGGIQEEISSLGKTALVMRESTERAEAVEAGVSELVGTDPARLANRIQELLDHPRPAARPADLFGDGHAAERIVRILEAALPA